MLGDDLHKKNQYFGFIIILLIIGVLQYYRKIVSGYKMTKSYQALYLLTMCTFVLGTMFILYYTEMNNIASFLIGLFVTTTSDSIAKFLMRVDENFNKILYAVVWKYLKLDLNKIIKKKNSEENDTENNEHES